MSEQPRKGYAVFISVNSQDKQWAGAACAVLKPRALGLIAGLLMLAAGAATGTMFTQSAAAEPAPESSPAFHAEDNSSGPEIQAAKSVAPVGDQDTQHAQSNPVKALIITGDNIDVHPWKVTTKVLTEILEDGGKVKVEVTGTPSKDLTDGNLSKYDVLILNYKDTDKGAPESRWSDENKQAFLKAVREGKGLVVCHYAFDAFYQAQLGRIREGDRWWLAVAGVPRAQARLHGQEDGSRPSDLPRFTRSVCACDR